MLMRLRGEPKSLSLPSFVQ